MYHDKCKVLSWVGDPEGTQTNDHLGVHSKPDQLNYLSGFYIYAHMLIHEKHLMHTGE